MNRAIPLLCALIVSCAYREAGPSPAAAVPPPASSTSSSANGDSHGEHTHRFTNADEWAPRFEDPERDLWQKPAEVIAALELRKDAVVADIGSATGYFSVRLAQALPNGRVYGVDIESDMIRYLAERAQKEGLTNLLLVLAEPNDAKLPEPVDLALIVDTYHHIEYRPAYFQRLRERLKSDGRVAIIDFRRGQPKGPPDAAKIPPDGVKLEMEQAGYRLVVEHTFLPNQYFLVFRK